jgi:hypothetical protein
MTSIVSKPLIPLKPYLILWLMLACFVLVLMLTHQSETPVFLGRYSESYALHLGILFSGILIVLGCITFAPEILSTQIQSHSIALLWGGLFGVGVVITQTTIPNASGLFRLFMLFSLAYFCIYPLQLIHSLKIPFVFYVALSLLICGVAIFVYVGKSPVPIMYDEPTLARWAVHFARTNDPVLPTHPVSTPYIALYPLGVVLNTLGVTYTNSRITVLLFVLLSLPFVYVLINRYFGRNYALFAVVYGVFLALQQSYFRVDVVIPLCIVIGMACYEHAQGRFWWYVLSGFAFAATLEAHLLGLVYGLALGLLLTFQYARTLIKTRKFFWYTPFWGLLIGGILLVVFYFGVRVIVLGISLPDFIQRLEFAYVVEQSFSNSPFPARIFIVFAQSFIGFVNAFPFNFFVVFGSILFYKHLPKLQIWLQLLVISVILYAFINPKTNYTYYYIHALPIILFIMAGFLSYITEKFSAIACAILISFSLVFMVGILQDQATQSGSREIIEISYEINDVLPTNTGTIMGWETYYWGLQDRNFIFTFSYLLQDGAYTIAGIEPIIEDTIARFNLPPMEAIIITKGLDDLLVNPRLFMQENNFVRARCFTASKVNIVVELYVAPHLLPNMKDENCP